MTIAAKHSAIQENTLIVAIICSVLLHGLLVVFIPNLKFDAVKRPDVLEIALVKKTEPTPIALPEQIQPKPEVVKPKTEPKSAPKPFIKPLPIANVVKNDPVPTRPPPVSTPQTPIIAVAPKSEVAPALAPTVPIVAAPPPQPMGPSQSEIDDARNLYGNALWGAIGKHKQYPKIAQMRGWQGETMVELQLDGSGKLKSKKIVQSSGYDALDKQALDMVEKAAPFPMPPDVLRGNSFSIRVPIPFKLEAS